MGQLEIRAMVLFSGAVVVQSKNEKVHDLKRMYVGWSAVECGVRASHIAVIRNVAGLSQQF